MRGGARTPQACATATRARTRAASRRAPRRRRRRTSGSSLRPRTSRRSRPVAHASRPRRRATAACRAARRRASRGRRPGSCSRPRCARRRAGYRSRRLRTSRLRPSLRARPERRGGRPRPAPARSRSGLIPWPRRGARSRSRRPRRATPSASQACRWRPTPALRAELAVAPERTTETLAKYKVEGEAVRRALDEDWGRRARAVPGYARGARTARVGLQGVATPEAEAEGAHGAATTRGRAPRPRWMTGGGCRALGPRRRLRCRLQERTSRSRRADVTSSRRARRPIASRSARARARSSCASRSPTRGPCSRSPARASSWWLRGASASQRMTSPSRPAKDLSVTAGGSLRERVAGDHHLSVAGGRAGRGRTPRATGERGRRRHAREGEDRARR